MVNLGPLAAEIVSLVWRTPANFNGFRVLAALLHGTLVVGVSQTAAFNRGRHLYSAGRPSRWALARTFLVAFKPRRLQVPQPERAPRVVWGARPFRCCSCSGKALISRDCDVGWSSHSDLGCKVAEFAGDTATMCYCDTELCNAAPMTSSFGHVIVMWPNDDVIVQSRDRHVRRGYQRHRCSPVVKGSPCWCHRC